MLFFHKKKRRVWPWAVFLGFLFCITVGAGLYIWAKQLTLDEVLDSSILKREIQKKAGDEGVALWSLLPDFLGYTGPRTYLFLFLNNTEIRPGGGFIGSYAVVTVDRGKTRIEKIEGTEVLDAATPDTWTPKAPGPLTEHLGVDRWYFRDSNWSPDFGTSAIQAVALYKGEGGALADRIDTVVGVTPTVLETLLEFTGPVTVNGITFDAKTAVETLEYEVEFDYKKRGLSFEQRKEILEPLMMEIVGRLKQDMFHRYPEYLGAIHALFDEKQILVYSLFPELQKKLDRLQWSGQIAQGEGDSVMWVDANVAALKTDHAIARTLSYSFQRQENGRYRATASMTYTHGGAFDWRTTRYRTYARVFVPEGSTWVETKGSMKTDRSNEPGSTDQGTELGKQWFGSFIAIEPGKTGTLSFVYDLPESLTQKIDEGSYTLFVQKQPGVVGSGLTLDLDFGINVAGATPGEIFEQWGDARYQVETNFNVDKKFAVTIAK
ncbi:MAG TPA: hypothetical protein DCY48_04300 [Candidatus Magasanikbacteria bacterium]|nr:MAG: hypothetical protein A3I74_00145 [Candidatus Magasanikbacteria bacterium RIFCSPLOWO2_02_FULL_47_16]OGH80133.1 MAG: hypothetical protein A3C10_03085 [Candidatus Magasanikbacteria bacterium RIFCSPHIGHO2_02_FULL_48_18]OGH82645.1 MAG: hypothetical protein A3G08_02805 [Candidatus Magasanikbacteria bacterium RIFCSPLOWO2_12_FULL_47_9b]HAZ28964.1 hypothetical protein [Candidatus Magasanikbacteria bacterium]